MMTPTLCTHFDELRILNVPEEVARHDRDWVRGTSLDLFSRTR